MRKADTDYLLRRMESHDNVSDLNFSVAKPPQVSVGELTPWGSTTWREGYSLSD
jgi:hypothetical protein